MNKLFHHYQHLSRAAATLLILLLTMTAQTAWAFDITIDGLEWTCTVIDGTQNVKIKPKTLSSVPESVTIPGTVIDQGTNYTVTEIDSYAFDRCNGNNGGNLKSVTIPESVTKIGIGAFLQCSNLATYSGGSGVTVIEIMAFQQCGSLTSFTIPSGVTVINQNTFMQSGLTSITIPSNVTKIGEDSFKRCGNLASVSIPASVTEIKDNPFSGCGNLSAITVDEGNPNYKIVDGVLYSKDDKTLIAYTIPKSGTTYTIPASVETIGSHAFNGCSSLQSITIPASVKTIGGNAFNGCTGLTSIDIPASVETIESDAFNGCSGLRSITIPASVKTIGSHAFNSCTGLTSITIPASVTRIGEKAFEGCFSLTSITLNSNPNIGGYAFPNGATVTMKLTANEGATGEYWMTFYNWLYSFAVDATKTKVYKAAVSGSSVKLTEVADIPANNAAILKSTASAITLTRDESASADFEGNELQASLTDKYAAWLTYAYCLSKNASNQVGFYKFSGSSGGDEIIPANHAYLVISGTNGARSFYGIDYDTTAIEGPAPAMTEERGEVYDLSGRRVVGQPQKGIYVRNGRKFIVK